MIFLNLHFRLYFFLFFFEQSVLKAMERVSRQRLFGVHCLGDPFFLRKWFWHFISVIFFMVFFHLLQIHDEFHFVWFIYFFSSILFMIFLIGAQTLSFISTSKSNPCRVQRFLFNGFGCWWEAILFFYEFFKIIFYAGKLLFHILEKVFTRRWSIISILELWCSPFDFVGLR